jgi:hypothetical protein
MRFLARGIKLPNVAAVQRSHDTDARHHGRAVELDGGLILRRRSYIFVTYKPSRSSDLLVIISAREVESRYRCEPGGGFLLFLAGSDGGF